jgi:hypothetical protein
MYNDAINTQRAMNDQVGMFNTSENNTTSRFNAGLETQTNQFNAGQANQISMFNAGEQNQAAYNNQQTRFAGGVQAGNMANQIRADNDAITRFNKEQSQITARFNAGLASQEASRVTGLAGTRADAGFKLSDTNSGLDREAFTTGQGTNNDIFGRTTGQTNLGIGAAGTTHGIRTGTNAIQGSIGQQDFENGISAFGPFITGTGVSSGLREQEEATATRNAGLGILAASNPRYRLGA